ncbi:MAG TPA: hypothetical protein VMJ70_03850 [Candidatus Sulfotelmatobacter sp.]|nr:hypothetical protein [Candidatus Sulfotelmatobacter sp.]
MSHRARFILRAGLASIALSLGLTGCFNPFDPRLSNQSGISEPAPNPNTTSNILNLFAWCWNHRAIDEYSEVFTDDFQFQFAATDSAGNAFTGRALFRQQELDTARHLFVEGTASEPPASSINLVLDRNFVAFPDSRPGKAYPWHQEIRTTVTLAIQAGDQDYRILGYARFFVTRGDSAKIPDELVRRGFRPDVNRWYIERWEDETVEGAGGLIANGGESHLLHAALEEKFGALPAERAPSVNATKSATDPFPINVSWGWVKYVYAR